MGEGEEGKKKSKIKNRIGEEEEEIVERMNNDKKTLYYVLVKYSPIIIIQHTFDFPEREAAVNTRTSLKLRPLIESSGSK